MPDEEIITWPGEPLTAEDFSGDAGSNKQENSDAAAESEAITQGTLHDSLKVHTHNGVSEEGNDSGGTGQANATAQAMDSSTKSPLGTPDAPNEPSEKIFGPDEINVTLNSSAFEDSQASKNSEMPVEDYIPILKAKLGPPQCVQLRFDTCIINAVVDTGCGCILMPRTQFQELGVPFKPLRRLRLVTASDDPIMGDEVGPVKFRLGSQWFCDYIVVTARGSETLLGLDFLKKHSILIDPANDRLIYRNEIIPLVDPTPHVPLRVISSAKRVIPASSWTFIEANLDTKNPPEYPLHCEPYDRNGLVILPGIYDPDHKKVMMVAWNRTNKSIRIKRAATIGETEPLDPLETHSTPAQPRAAEPHVDHWKKWETDPELRPPPDGWTTVTDEEVINFDFANIPEHLRDLYERSQGILNAKDKVRLAKILIRWQDAFARNDEDIGLVKDFEHHIDTGTAKPIRQPPRRIPTKFAEEAGKEVERMLRMGVIRPCVSEWSSNPVLVRKKTDGSLRFCVDFRPLNSVTTRECFGMPRTDEVFEFLSGKKIFSTIDANSGFWQLAIAEEDQKKTNFQTPQGSFCFRRVAFGLTNSPMSYSRANSQILRGLLYKIVLAYLDDTFVPTPDIESHFPALDLVFERLVANNLKAKPRKCVLFQEEINVLGRIATGGQIKVSDKDTETIRTWPRPRNLKALRKFLGFTSYHRTFVKDFQEIAAPLNELLEKDAKFSWNEDRQKAFEKLKEVMVNPPILSLPRDTGDFILDTDASNSGLGAILIQVQDGEEKVLAYASCALTKEQKRYCTTRKELLSVIRFTRQFKHLLLGRHFICRSDHSSLRWLKNFKDASNQLARWLEELQQYHFTIKHRPGKEHANADALSRLPEDWEQCEKEVKPSDLPCGGCSYCTNLHEKWAEFTEEVDNVVPLGMPVNRLTTSAYGTEEIGEVHPSLMPEEVEQYLQFLEEGIFAHIETEEPTKFPPNGPAYPTHLDSWESDFKLTPVRAVHTRSTTRMLSDQTTSSDQLGAASIMPGEHQQETPDAAQIQSSASREDPIDPTSILPGGQSQEASNASQVPTTTIRDEPAEGASILPGEPLGLCEEAR